MSERVAERPAVFTIPSHRSFADALAAGLIRRFGREPLGLARGRILLPNNRAVRALTEAFVRESGAGLLLPRLIPIGDPELDDRIGGALEPLGDTPIPPAIGRLERSLILASIVRGECASSAEALRLTADLTRALDAIEVEEIDPRRLREAVGEASDLASHWERALEKLQLIVDQWPGILADHAAIDLTERRNRVLRRIAERWKSDPPSGFTVAAGITTAAPAVAAVVGRVARMPEGMVVLPGLWLANVMPDTEWDALGPDERGRGEPTHPQYHLKLLLDRIGVAREEVRPWRYSGRAPSPPARSRAIANAMAAPAFSHKWETLRPAERRLGGIRVAEFPDSAAEAQAIALALREAVETPGKTSALVTPDRQLAKRVSGCSRGGESQRMTAPARRCRRPRPGLCCSESRRPRPRNWGRWRCSPCQAPAGRRGRRRAARVAGRRSGDRPQAPRPAAAGRPGRTRFDARRPRVAAGARANCRGRRAAERAAAARSFREAADRGGSKGWRATPRGEGRRAGWQPSFWASCRPPRLRRK